MGRVGDAVEIKRAVAVERIGIFFLQTLAKSTDFPQRFAQIVGGNVGKMLQIGIGFSEDIKLLFHVGEVRYIAQSDDEGPLSIARFYVRFEPFLTIFVEKNGIGNCF